jgi:hypothetical protein
MTEIKVGDIVTWRSGKSKTKGFMPMGISGCKVIGFGEAENGKPAATLDTGRFGEVNAYVADLELEQ